MRGAEGGGARRAPPQRGQEVRGDLHDGRELGENAVEVGGGEELGAGAHGGVQGGVDIGENVFDCVDVLDLGLEVTFDDLVGRGHGGGELCWNRVGELRAARRRWSASES